MKEKHDERLIVSLLGLFNSLDIIEWPAYDGKIMINLQVDSPPQPTNNQRLYTSIDGAEELIRLLQQGVARARAWERSTSKEVEDCIEK
jgi:hypothetical protein